jgi:hypothetical protein
MVLKVKEPVMDEQLKLFKLILPEQDYLNLVDWMAKGLVKPAFAFYNVAFHYGPNFSQVVAANMPLAVPTLQSIADGGKTANSVSMIATKKAAKELYTDLAKEMEKLGHKEEFFATAPEEAKAFSEEAIFNGTVSKPLKAFKAKSTLDEILKSKGTYTEASAPKKAEPVILDFEGTEKKISEFAKHLNILKDSNPYVEPAKYDEPAKEPLTAEEVLFTNPMNVLALKDAIKLGQRVKGTSPKSKYYFVAKAGNLKIAVRNCAKDGIISIRAEGTPMTLSHMKNRLIEAGMTQSDDKTYFSMHVNNAVHTELGDKTIPTGRILGSFLMGLDVGWTKMVMNMGDIPEDKQ